MPYSAVTQPWPELRRNGGTFSSIEAVHRTCVSPNFARHEASAYLLMPIKSSTARISSAARPDGRMGALPQLLVRKCGGSYTPACCKSTAREQQLIEFYSSAWGLPATIDPAVLP